jgi:hypothetical protein
MDIALGTNYNSIIAGLSIPKKVQRRLNSQRRTVPTDIGCY